MADNEQLSQWKYMYWADSSAETRNRLTTILLKNQDATSWNPVLELKYSQNNCSVVVNSEWKSVHEDRMINQCFHSRFWTSLLFRHTHRHTRLVIDCSPAKSVNSWPGWRNLFNCIPCLIPKTTNVDWIIKHEPLFVDGLNIQNYQSHTTISSQCPNITTVMARNINYQ